MTKRAKYHEGDALWLPLRGRSDGVQGVIARVAKGNRVLLGYFFADVLPLAEASIAVLGRSRHDAVLVRRFGDLGIISSRWHVIERPPSVPWDRELWPVPLFAARQEISGKCSLVEYSTDDIGVVSTITSAPCEQVKSYPKDGLCGAGAVEILMTDLLRNLPPR